MFRKLPSPVMPQRSCPAALLKVLENEGAQAAKSVSLFGTKPRYTAKMAHSLELSRGVQQKMAHSSFSLPAFTVTRRNKTGSRAVSYSHRTFPGHQTESSASHNTSEDCACVQ